MYKLCKINNYIYIFCSGLVFHLKMNIWLTAPDILIPDDNYSGEQRHAERKYHWVNNRRKMEMSHEMWIIRTAAMMLDVQKVIGTPRYQRWAINTHNYVQTAQKSWCALKDASYTHYLSLPFMFLCYFLPLSPFLFCYPLLSLYS